MSYQASDAPLFQQTIITRGYELNAAGRIPPAVIARYCEHARWFAMASDQLGLGFGRGSRIVLRAQAHEFLVPLSFDVPLRLTLDVGRVGRSSVDFREVMQRAADGVVVGVCRATLVMVGADGRPALVPPQIHDYVRPAEMPEVTRFDEAAPVDAYRCAVEIRPCDIDLLQHVNHAKYVEFADNVLQLAGHAGAFGALSARALGPVIRLHADYRNETRLGQTLHASAWPLNAEASAFGIELRHADVDTVSCRLRVEVE